MKFGTEMDHKHAYKFCVKSLSVNYYKYGDGAKFWGYIRKI
jgi:hypothetical protein